MAPALLVLLLLWAGADAGTPGLPRRALAQAGTMRFMNAPITEAVESAPAAPAQRPSKPAAAPAKPKTSTQRGLLAADAAATRGHKWRHERHQHFRRGDHQWLKGLLGGTSQFGSIRPQPIAPPTSAPGLAQPGGGLWRQPRSAANSLAQAYSGGQGDAAAQAVASAAAGGSGGASSSAVAQAVADTAATHPAVAPGLLAKSASVAVTRGQTDPFARMIADALSLAKRQSTLPSLVPALCDAINTGGDQTRYAYGQAIAKAIAGGGDSQAAVAEATATAFCAGGSTAQAWASAYAVALSTDSRGCLVLNQARAMAEAKCGADSFADAQSEASSTVLGFCGLLEPSTGGSWSGSDGGSRSASGSGGGGGGGGGGWGADYEDERGGRRL